jgi:transcription initiation factor TFIID subunit TAF12
MVIGNGNVTVALLRNHDSNNNNKQWSVLMASAQRPKQLAVPRQQQQQQQQPQQHPVPPVRFDVTARKHNKHVHTPQEAKPAFEAALRHAM